MANLSAKRKRPRIGAFAESGDTSAIVDRGGAECYGPSCTAHKDQVCQITDCLSNCNELLFDFGLELREQRGGSLSLVSIDISDINLIPRPSPDFYRGNPFLRWLLKTHVCITTLELIDGSVMPHSQIVLPELSENSRLKKLSLRFCSDDATQSHITTLLPRLRMLEKLHYYIECRRADALVTAVSALLRTTTSLTTLVFHTCFDRSQPPKTIIDALTFNKTLKSLEMGTYWRTAEPPGHLGEYVKSNRLITNLSIFGYDVDREELLLDDAVVRNDTLSTLVVSNVCGGERTVRFLTRLLAECTALKKLDVSWARLPYAKITEATITRCAEALAENETLEELLLPYSLWHSSNWIAFFALLPRNKHLKSLQVTHRDRRDYETFPVVLEALAQTDSLSRVTFGDYILSFDINLMHFVVFSDIGIFGEESVQVSALQRLYTLEHFTSLSMDLSDAGERVLSALAKYIRKTTVLRKLSLTVTSPRLPPNASTYWTLLLQSMSANTSVSDIYIYSNGNFQYNDCLARTIGHSRYIARASFLLNTGDGNATDFVLLLSETIGDNYNLLKVNWYCSKVGIEARRSLFTIRETTRRNSGLVERAAAFNQSAQLEWYTATAIEKVSQNPALVRELAQKEGIAADEVARIVRSRLRSIEGLHDFMRLTGVVKECVTCAPPVDGSSMQLQDLNADCWRLVRRYLSFDDVKRFTISKQDLSTLI